MTKRNRVPAVSDSYPGKAHGEAIVDAVLVYSEYLISNRVGKTRIVGPLNDGVGFAVPYDCEVAVDIQVAVIGVAIVTKLVQFDWCRIQSGRKHNRVVGQILIGLLYRRA